MLSMFDGRLDNRAELLEALELQSSSRSPLSDGDIARAAYERWEGDAVPRLLGDFAWAVWNDRDRRLMLARDHSVLRSLFFSRGKGFVAFGTGYRSLLSLPEIPREVDELSAADLLMNIPDHGERSFYRGISWVGSAMRVVISADRTHQDRLWEPVRRPTLRLSRDEEYIEAARAVFEEAVSCRLRLAGPVVSAVSGGLDSSAVAATAARQAAPGVVHGLCMVPVGGAPVHVHEGRYGDERPLVAALAARHPNFRVEYLEAAEAQSVELDPVPLFLQGGVPSRGISNAAWFMPMFRRAAELGAGTLLLGMWGNFTFSFSGYPRLSELREEGAWMAFARELAALRSTQPRVAWNGLARYHGMSMLPPWAQAGVRRLRNGPAGSLSNRPVALNPDFVRSANLTERYAEFRARVRETQGANGQASLMRIALFGSRIMVDGMAAFRSFTGITSSDPFSDRRVIDFCLSLPSEQFLHGGVWRRLARRAFADRLPPEITNNPLRGLQDSDWHARLTPCRGHFAAEIERLERSALASRILDLPRMRRMLADWPDDPRAVKGSGIPLRYWLLHSLHVGQYLRWIEGGNQ